MEKPGIEKLTVIGGGSSYTPELIDGFIQHEDKLQVGEIVLFDIDRERLNVVGGMAQRMVQHAELDTKVTLSLDRPAAVEGASFVLSSMRVGQMPARIRDEKIPLKYGVIGQETTGPGGTLKAWRTIPVTLDIARDMARYAPEAWYVNFTNPSGIITEAILKHTGLKVVGHLLRPGRRGRRVVALLRAGFREHHEVRGQLPDQGLLSARWQGAQPVRHLDVADPGVKSPLAQFPHLVLQRGHLQQGSAQRHRAPVCCAHSYPFR